MKKKHVIFLAALLSVVLATFIYCQVDKYATAKREAIKIIEQQIAKLQKNGGGSSERIIKDGYYIISNADDMQFVLNYIKHSSANRFPELPFISHKEQRIYSIQVGTIMVYISALKYFRVDDFNGKYLVNYQSQKKMLNFLQTFQHIDAVE